MKDLYSNISDKELMKFVGGRRPSLENPGGSSYQIPTSDTNIFGKPVISNPTGRNIASMGLGGWQLRQSNF